MRRDPQDLSGGRVSGRSADAAEGFQQPRRPPRQPRDHDARHPRQHPYPKRDAEQRRGGMTKHPPSGKRMPIHDAAMRCKAESVPLVIFGGKECRTGSSRDWAA